MFILALDCSTSRGSVAIGRQHPDDEAAGSDGGGLLWEKLFPAGRGHGGELFSSLQEGLHAVGIKTGAGDPQRRLTKILVGLGPGSYAGVRQAIAVATGLSMATGAVLAGLPSPLALESIGSGDSVHVIGDARRGTFYYTVVADGHLLHSPELLDDAAGLLERLAAHPEWPVLAAESVPVFLPPGVEAIAALPLASRLLTISPAFHRIGPLEPIYLRPPSITLPRPAI